METVRDLLAHGPSSTVALMLYAWALLRSMLQFGTWTMYMLGVGITTFQASPTYAAAEAIPQWLYASLLFVTAVLGLYGLRWYRTRLERWALTLIFLEGFGAMVMYALSNWQSEAWIAAAVRMISAGWIRTRLGTEY